MRIVHVSETLVSGVLEVMSSLAQAHAAEGHEVSIVGSDLKPNTPADWRDKFDLCARVDVLPLRHNPGPWDVSAAFRLRRLLRTIRPDVVHLHASKAGAVGRLAALGLGAKVVYQPHGAIAMADGRKASVLRSFETALSALPGQLVACSESERQVLVASSRQTEVAMIPNGIPTHEAVSDFSILRSSNPRPLVATCGRVCDQKNPDLFAELALELRDEADFLWIGDGDEVLKAGLIRAGVHVSSWVQHDVVLEMLRTSDIYLQTSRYEGMPISVLEAMSLGLPVVATNIAGNRDVVTESVTGFLGDDVPALAASLRRIIADKELAQSLGQSGRRILETDFSAPAMAHSFLELYSVG